MLKKLVHTHLQQELSRICRSYVRIFTATIYPIVLQQLLLPGLVRVGGLFQGWRDMLGFTHVSSSRCTIHLPFIIHPKSIPIWIISGLSRYVYIYIYRYTYMKYTYSTHSTHSHPPDLSRSLRMNRSFQPSQRGWVHCSSRKLQGRVGDFGG